MKRLLAFGISVGWGLIIIQACGGDSQSQTAPPAPPPVANPATPQPPVTNTATPQAPGAGTATSQRTPNQPATTNFATPQPPSYVHAIPLTSANQFPQSQRAALAAVVDDLRKGGENPEAFYAEVDVEGGLFIFHLWHSSAFLPENLGPVCGNPGGLCRDFHVDRATNQVVERLWWQ